MTATDSEFEYTSTLFGERTVYIPGVGRVELDPSIQRPEEPCVRELVLFVDGVRHRIEGGPDAWSAVYAALIELRNRARPEAQDDDRASAALGR